MLRERWGQEMIQQPSRFGQAQPNRQQTIQSPTGSSASCKQRLDEVVNCIRDHPSLVGACVFGVLVLVAAACTFVPGLANGSLQFEQSSGQDTSTGADLQSLALMAVTADGTGGSSDAGEAGSGGLGTAGSGVGGAGGLGDEACAAIYVHVAGAVANPGVYALREGDRVMDAVEAAGGCETDACPDAVNLARMVTDGERVVIPTQEEIAAAGGLANVTGGDESGGGGDASDASSLININTANQSALEELPGIGPTTASAIIEYRQRFGGFSCIEDLMEVDGIGEKKFERISGLVCV